PLHVTGIGKIIQKRIISRDLRLNHRKTALHTTRVLPIVGLDGRAIGSMLLSALVRAEGTLWNIRIIF
ncbi:MAG TPA: hypothetical protein VF700_06975, partial [Segetibacter sp.]